MVARAFFPPRLKPIGLIRPGRSMMYSVPALPGPPPLTVHDLNAGLKRLVQSGQLEDALAMFDGAPHRDEASYSTLLAGQAATGDFAGAMALFSRFRGSCPPLAVADPFVLSLVFKARASAADPGSLLCAASLHAFAVRSSAVASVFVATALADVYAKAGCLDLALMVFDEMPFKNVVSRTTLMATLTRAGRPHDALRRFSKMYASGVPCNSHAYGAALKACTDSGLHRRGRELHALCAKLGFDAMPYIANTLATLYARCGDVDRALGAVSRMSSRDVAAWTTVISSYAKTGRAKEAIQGFIAMLRVEASNAASPNEYTYAAVIAVCVDISSVCLGEQLHAQAAKRGLVTARSVANSLVTLYARSAGCLWAADSVFRESAIKDAASWRSFISGYAQKGLVGEAFALFTEMRQQHSPCPNEFTLASLLRVCAAAATLDAGCQLHALAVIAGFEHHAMIRSALVNMYGKIGSMSDADVVFSNRTKDDVVSWTVMIVGHAEHGHGKRAVELFEEMCYVGLKPDHDAFIGVLNACCHLGEVELGLRYLNAMSKSYGLKPGKEHYGYVVDLLDRAGLVNEAEGLIGRMVANERDGVVWTSLLRACAARAQKKTTERVMEVEPWGAGAHVAMINPYASKGQWGKAAQEHHSIENHPQQMP